MMTLYAPGTAFAHQRSGTVPHAQHLEAIPTRSAEEDADLARRARERSPSAWATIYDLHYRKLFAYCFARTGDRGAAAALAAQAFLRAVAEVDRYNGQPLSVWLYQVTRHVVDAEVAAGTPPRAGDTRADAVDATTALVSQLAELPTQEREAFALRYFAGYTSEEVAAALGEETTTVRRLEARALAAIGRMQAVLVGGASTTADTLISATKDRAA